MSERPTPYNGSDIRDRMMIGQNKTRVLRRWWDPDAPAWVKELAKVMQRQEPVPDDHAAAFGRWCAGEDVAEPE